MNQELLTRCSNAAAPSGFEGPVRSIIRQEIGSITQASTTTAGNIVCTLPGSGGPTVALLSHMDEIGFMVPLPSHKNARSGATLGVYPPRAEAGFR